MTDAAEPQMSEALAESYKPRAKRVGAGMLLIVALAVLVGYFIVDIGFFPGRGAQGGGSQQASTATASSQSTSGPSSTGETATSASGNPIEHPEGEGEEIELRLVDERILIERERSYELSWVDLDGLLERAVASERTIKLVVFPASVTIGLVERVKRKLGASGLQWYEERR